MITCGRSFSNSPSSSWLKPASVLSWVSLLHNYLFGALSCSYRKFDLSKVNSLVARPAIFGILVGKAVCLSAYRLEYLAWLSARNSQSWAENKVSGPFQTEGLGMIYMTHVWRDLGWTRRNLRGFLSVRSIRGGKISEFLIVCRTVSRQHTTFCPSTGGAQSPRPFSSAAWLSNKQQLFSPVPCSWKIGIWSRIPEQREDPTPPRLALCSSEEQEPVRSASKSVQHKVACPRK